jgi:hypothetical protein
MLRTLLVCALAFTAVTAKQCSTNCGGNEAGDSVLTFKVSFGVDRTEGDHDSRS